ncbi:hypothetical protein O181_004999 [Austropuccinia psidii MF-1]|uniref:Uncharacterized protein n=1 Tax=Austropuccinia psidii MF-1 TaxID=1389203 RepID=A0A9Q3BGS4_9BASI|nr:hypothetical protein [Austropuccinia psidii MF-1]
MAPLKTAYQKTWKFVTLRFAPRRRDRFIKHEFHFDGKSSKKRPVWLNRQGRKAPKTTQKITSTKWRPADMPTSVETNTTKLEKSPYS